jgi:DNA polymerase elongation subunit (family B)
VADVARLFDLDYSTVYKIDHEVLRRLIQELKILSHNSLIYGKDTTPGITAIEVVDGETWIFTSDGKITKKQHYFWVLATKPLEHGFFRLEGMQHYCYMKEFPTKNSYYGFLKKAENRKWDTFTVYNDKESTMILNGYTFYKGMSISDLGVLSFDIESNGLAQDDESNIFIITSVFKKNDEITEKHFRLDQFTDAGKMLDAWCNWVQSINPDIVNGHNIISYDLPYMTHVAKLYGTTLKLGKDISDISFSPRESQYRVDGSQTWAYKKVSIFGRQVIDGMFLAVKYDIGRKYESWGLKAIAKAEGLNKVDRQFYDASLIGKNWHDPVEREKICQYAIDDAQDSMKLFELMIPSYFIMCQMVPKPFQMLIEGASGSWLNTMMIRSYLQEGGAIPKACEVDRFEGAISYGNPGIYRNCLKLDATSLYPSIMLQYNIHDKVKDYKGYMIVILDYLRTERLKNKKIAKETNSEYYKALEGSQKILINSLYGFMGTNGLNFNYPKGAAEVTRHGREILEKSIQWATSNPYSYWKEKNTSEETNE